MLAGLFARQQFRHVANELFVRAVIRLSSSWDQMIGRLKGDWMSGFKVNLMVFRSGQTSQPAVTGLISELLPLLVASHKSIREQKSSVSFTGGLYCPSYLM